jgi:hypothetical protein
MTEEPSGSSPGYLKGTTRTVLVDAIRGNSLVVCACDCMKVVTRMRGKTNTEVINIFIEDFGIYSISFT